MKIVIAIVVVVAVLVLLEYNALTSSKNRIEAAQQELDKYLETGDDRDVDNARKYLNAVIRDYNNKVDSFPGSLIADVFNFPKMHTEDFDEGL